MIFYFYEKSVIEELSDSELIAITREYNLEAIPNDSPLRALTYEVWGNDDLMNMLSLAVPISAELANRLEAIVGRGMENPYGITKENIEDFFLKASEEEGNGETMRNVDINYEHEVLVIKFHVISDYGIHPDSYVQILPDGRVITSLCELLEGGGVDALFKGNIEKHLKKFAYKK